MKRETSSMTGDVEHESRAKCHVPIIRTYVQISAVQEVTC